VSVRGVGAHPRGARGAAAAARGSCQPGCRLRGRARLPLPPGGRASCPKRGEALEAGPPLRALGRGGRDGLLGPAAGRRGCAGGLYQAAAVQAPAAGARAVRRGRDAVGGAGGVRFRRDARASGRGGRQG